MIIRISNRIWKYSTIDLSTYQTTLLTLGGILLSITFSHWGAVINTQPVILQEVERSPPNFPWRRPRLNTIYDKQAIYQEQN